VLNLSDIIFLRTTPHTNLLAAHGASFEHGYKTSYSTTIIVRDFSIEKQVTQSLFVVTRL